MPSWNGAKFWRFDLRHSKHNLPEQDSNLAMSSENLLKNGKKHVVIVGAGEAGMASHAHLLGKNLLTSSLLESSPGTRTRSQGQDIFVPSLVHNLVFMLG